MPLIDPKNIIIGFIIPSIKYGMNNIEESTK